MTCLIRSVFQVQQALRGSCISEQKRVLIPSTSDHNPSNLNISKAQGRLAAQKYLLAEQMAGAPPSHECGTSDCGLFQFE